MEHHSGLFQTNRPFDKVHEIRVEEGAAVVPDFCWNWQGEEGLHVAGQSVEGSDFPFTHEAVPGMEVEKEMDDEDGLLGQDRFGVKVGFRVGDAGK